MQSTFLLFDTVPCNLLGRDILSKFQCTISYTPEGVFVTSLLTEIEKDVCDSPHVH